MGTYLPSQKTRGLIFRRDQLKLKKRFFPCSLHPFGHKFPIMLDLSVPFPQDGQGWGDRVTEFACQGPMTSISPAVIHDPTLRACVPFYPPSMPPTSTSMQVPSYIIDLASQEIAAQHKHLAAVLYLYS